MSPDGKWIWDGAQWRPIPVHEAAFPNWKGVGAGFVPGVDTAAPAVAVAPTAAARHDGNQPSYRLAGPAPGLAVPNWGSGSKRFDVRRYALLAIAAAALVVVIVVVSVVATLILSNRGTSTPTTTITTPKAGGPTARSDSAEAAYIVKSVEGPLADQKDTIAVLRQTCNAMSSSCEDYYITMGNNLAPILPTIDQATIPLCIAAPVAALRQQVARALDGQQLALKAFQDNKKAAWATAYTQVSGALAQAGLQFAAVKNAVPSCDTALNGP